MQNPPQNFKKMMGDFLKEDQMNAQYSVNRTPTHSHNGLDSPKIDFGAALTSRQFFVTSHIAGTAAASSGNYGHFFYNTFNFDMLNNVINNTTGGINIICITEVHGRAGNDAGTVSLNVAILNPGDVSLSGGTVIAGPFNLKGTADQASYSSWQGRSSPVLYPAQRLALQTSGTLTNVADVLVTVLMQY